MKGKLNIYLLRGLTRESGHWGSFIEMLQKDLPDAIIHTMDLPGSGKYFKEKASIKAAKMVDFMRANVLRDLKKSKKNIICATSLGGMLACDWTLRFKDDFQGLIIIGSSFKNICNAKERAQKSVRMDMLKILISSNLEKREGLIIKVNSNKPELFGELTKEWTLIQQKRRVTRANIFKQTIAGFLYGLKDEKPEVPLLIIGSKRDRLVCPKCIQKTHDAFGGTLVWHETSGHGIPIDEPKWLSEQIAAWISNKYIKGHVSEI